MYEIKCFDALSKAWNKMIVILFHPFDIVKWLVLGFCAWLATMGEGGSNFNFNRSFRTPGSGSGGGGGENFKEEFQKIIDFLTSPLGITIIASVIIFILLLILLVLWLKSRNEFIFLDNLLYNKAEIVAPWKEYRREGNSTMLWRIGFWLVSMGIGLFILLISGVLCYSWIKQCIEAKDFLAPDPIAIVGIAIFIIFNLVFSIILGIIAASFKEFVIPVMYQKRMKAMEAYGVVWQLMKSAPWAFVRYFLVMILLGIAVGILILLAGVLTCCIGFLVMALPYIGAVVLLPVLIWQRLYGVEFLAQFGDEFNLYVESQEEDESQDEDQEPQTDDPSEQVDYYR
jgi:hypothetical protein